MLSVTGDVFAFCHFDRAQCGFKINITQVRKTSLLTSSYGTYPTLASNEVPDMEILRIAFTLRDFPSDEIAPHFEAVSRRMTSPYARFQQTIPASNSRYLEIENIPPHAISAPARMMAGPSRMPTDSGSISASPAARVLSPLTAAGK
ncbi:hypothetical protein R3P38DRAFT_3233309 [Favolaschia claudopus]|uniref:Uncharacterized protein n=1 Tax=Favolaschia claudopus TaxID=2862362 RepID=A0AAV9ZIR9_9AGAR